jgi:hypothetical protein
VNQQDDFERNVRRLVAEVRRLEQGHGGTSETALQSVRKLVSQDLLQSDHPEVTARALGELDNSGATRLLKIVEHCSQTFYYSSSVLSVIALPVGVCWRSPLERHYELKRVNRTALNALEQTLSQRDGIRRVVFDTRPFAFASTSVTSIRDLREYLWHLNAGNQVATEQPTPHVVFSQADPGWQMFYLLGLEMSDPSARRFFTGHELDHQLPLGKSEFMDSVAAALQDPRQLISHCHGVWYLHEALRQGQKALRRHRLSELLGALLRSVAGESYIHFTYSMPMLSHRIELVASKSWLHLHGRWSLFQEETINDFVQELKNATKVIFGNDSDPDINFMEWPEFAQFLTEHGQGLNRKPR